jgi:chorismate-pyruvate lyase
MPVPRRTIGGRRRPVAAIRPPAAGPIVAGMDAGAAALLHPLDEFYAAAGRPLPVVEAIAATAVPAPLGVLLAEDGDDMTTRLARHHGQAIVLHVLARRRFDGVYARQVLLRGRADRAPVALAALRVRLDRCSPGVCRGILAERTPLGYVLRRHRQTWVREPGGLFRLRPDRFIGDAMAQEARAWLYGRRTRLLDARRAPLAEVVEILALTHVSRLARC